MDTPVVAAAEMTERSNQPTASSIMPAVRISWPMLRCSRRMSDNVLAITGIAETHIATPRNSAKTPRPCPATSAWGSTKPSAIPIPSGRSRPERLTRAAVRPRWRIRRVSICVPVMPTSNSTPSWPTASTRWICSGAEGGNNHCEAAGKRLPSNEGPTRTPASSSPTTAGRPSRWASLPSRKANPSKVMTVVSSTSNG